MKDDTISRQAVLDLLIRCAVPENGGSLLYHGIKQLPSAERHGHWKGINKNKYNDDEATCSVCGVTFSSDYSAPYWWDYCPNCGAKMDGDTE